MDFINDITKITLIICNSSDKHKILKRNKLINLKVMTLKEFITKYNASQKFIAYCDTSIPRLLFSNEYQANQDTIILIGPEGDFSKEEINLALENGYKPISLGDNRLRTETAALVACNTCHIINQINQI